MNNKKIVIAHYNEDLFWTQNLKFDGEVIIYSKTDKSNPDRYVPINKGQEVPMYLKYIIDFYDNLPDKTLFLHGHYHSPHQDYDSKFICENLNWDNSDFFSVNRRDWYQDIGDNLNTWKVHSMWLQECWEMFEGFLPFPNQGTMFYSGAQFVVGKELILKYPKMFYEKIYNWVLTKTINIPPQTSDEIISRVFEYIWHYVFTGLPIENKQDYSNIFKK